MLNHMGVTTIADIAMKNAAFILCAPLFTYFFANFNWGYWFIHFLASPTAIYFWKVVYDIGNEKKECTERDYNRVKKVVEEDFPSYAQEHEGALQLLGQLNNGSRWSS